MEIFKDWVKPMSITANTDTSADTASIRRSHYWHDYDRWARTYDSDARGHMGYQGHIKAAEKIAPFMRARRTPRLADLGTGTGFVLERLRRDFPNAVMDGYDFSPAMLDKCRAKNLADSLTECDLTDTRWPIAVESVDYVTSAGVLEMIYNAGDFLKNVQHILKPGGVAALTYEVQSMMKKGFMIAASAYARHPEDMESMAANAGMDIVDHEAFLGYRSYGRPFPYRVITLHKPAP